VAATVTVLSAAGLLGRTLMRLYEVDPGVRIENTLAMEVPLEGDRTPAQTFALQEEMRSRLAALPGVTEVGVGWNVPLRTSGVLLELKAEGRVEEPGVPKPLAEYRTATPEYFRAAGIPLIAGREFSATDRSDGGRVVVLNRALAHKLFPSQDPIGRRVAWTGDVLRFIPLSGEWRTVVGIVGDTRDAGPDAATPALPADGSERRWRSFGRFIIRAPAAPRLGPQAAQVVRELVPDQPIDGWPRSNRSRPSHRNGSTRCGGRIRRRGAGHRRDRDRRGTRVLHPQRTAEIGIG
jgi:hypothetical protein